MSRAREPIEQRIRRSIRHEGECWIWSGSQTKDGYGVLTVGRKQVRAHRASFEAFTGKDPDGLHVCHSCDTPLCVNPDHLFLGTPRDNTQDMIAKGRRAVARDTAHPNTKISHEQREAIRAMRLSGAKLQEIASRFGIAAQTVSAICNGEGSYGTR